MRLFLWPPYCVSHREIDRKNSSTYIEISDARIKEVLNKDKRKSTRSVSFLSTRTFVA